MKRKQPSTFVTFRSVRVGRILWPALFYFTISGATAAPREPESPPPTSSPAPITEEAPVPVSPEESQKQSPAQPRPTPDGGPYPWTPFQLALYHPIQLYSAGRDVFGLRLKLIHARNRRMHGIDLGFFNEAAQLRGIQFGFVNWLDEATGSDEPVESPLIPGTATMPPNQVLPRIAPADGSMYGLQLGLVNSAPGQVSGLQLGVAGNSAGTCKACIQIGGFNVSDGDVDGIQLGLLGNLAEGRVLAPQLALGWNAADRAYGGQISVGGNIADLAPFQIGGFFNGVDKSFFQLALGLNFSDATPLQIAGLGNHAAHGIFQIALGVNHAEELNGIQTAVLGNVAEAGNGIQIAGILNTADDFRGGQIALVGNIGENIRGLQFALIGNHATSGKVGQIAVFNNAGRIQGFQAGLVNFAGQVDGVQGGLVNRSLHTSGWMFGLINDADTLDGHQIGLVNIIRHGSLPIMVFYNGASMDPQCRSQRDCKGDEPRPAPALRPEHVPRSWTPIQFSLYHPAQLFSEHADVYGLRLSLFHGRNLRVVGLDLGGFNEAESLRGFQLGALNWLREPEDPTQAEPVKPPPRPDAPPETGADSQDVKQESPEVLAPRPVRARQVDADADAGTMRGIQLALLANNAPGPVSGLQLGLLGNRAGACEFCVQLGGVNISDGDVAGLQLGYIGNYADGDVALPQIGFLYNIAETAYSGQLSAGVNWATGGAPFQIGLIGNGSLDDDKGLSPLFQIGGVFNGAPDIPFQAAGGVNLSRSSWIQIAVGGNISVEKSKGLQLGGLFNYSGASRGLQLAGVFNHAEHHDGVQTTAGVNFAETMHGLQFALIGNHADEGNLVQIAAFNNGGVKTRGLQLGAVNFAAEHAGLQLGLVNRAEHVDGVMFGLINDAYTLDGYQFGLVNIVREKAWPVTVVFNAASMDPQCRKNRNCE